MKRSILLAACLAVTVSALLSAVPAAAATDADAYVFGTSLVITSPKALKGKDNWWASLLPSKYSYSQGTIVDAINEARAARGVKTEIDVAINPISIGVETKVAGGYEYNIDFLGMTPEDVAVALKSFPLTGALAGLKQKTRPVSTGFINGDSADSGATLTVNVVGQQLTFSRDDSYNVIYAAVTKALQARFGDRARFDLSLNYYTSVVPESSNSFNVSITVYLDGAEKRVSAGGEGD